MSVNLSSAHLEQGSCDSNTIPQMTSSLKISACKRKHLEEVFLQITSNLNVICVEQTAVKMKQLKTFLEIHDILRISDTSLRDVLLPV